MSQLDDAVLETLEFSRFLFDNLSAAIFIVDPDFRVRLVNNGYKEIFSREELEAIGYLCGNALGCSFAVVQGVECGKSTECGACKIRGTLAKVLQATDDSAELIIERDFFIQGHQVWKYLKMKVKRLLWNDTPFAVVAVEDITALEEHRRKIEFLANKDPLTGLSNRRHFFDVAETIFQNSLRGSGTVSVAMFDIDHFKRINDTWGHAGGDAVLREVSAVLSAHLRKADVLARFGGEEFCFLMHCHETDDSFLVTDKLRLFIEQHAFVVDGATVPVTISAGVSSFPRQTLDAMIEDADAALYRAKKAGRNRTEEFTETTGEHNA